MPVSAGRSPPAVYAPAVPDDIWRSIADEREALADVLDLLGPPEWETKSLCEGWTVRDVAAHLVMPLEHSMPVLLAKIVAARFDFDRMTDTAVRADHRDGHELAAALRAHRTSHFAPPGLGPAAPLTDIVVHGLDIRRPLAIPAAFSPETLRTCLDFVVSPRAGRGFTNRAHASAYRWSVPELGWSTGSGPLVEGPPDDVLLALLRRPVAYTDVSGDGAEQLRVGGDLP